MFKAGVPLVLDLTGWQYESAEDDDQITSKIYPASSELLRSNLIHIMDQSV